MRVVTINVPESSVECMEILLNLGLYNNRSEIVRCAVQENLRRQREISSIMQPDIYKTYTSVKVGDKHGGYNRKHAE